MLIIGILASIALPQYQKAVAKSRFVQLQVLGEALYKSQQIYHLANGSWATQLDELTVLPEGTLSDDKRNIMVSDSLYCRLNEDNYREVLCATDKPGVPAWLRRLDEDIRACLVRQGDTIALKICQQQNGVFYHSSAEYDYYKLP